MNPQKTSHCPKAGIRRAMIMILSGVCICTIGSVVLADNFPPPPAIEAAGSRYLAITPGAWESDVALQVIGFICVPWGVPQPCPGVECPIVDCVGLYVQADGVLGETPYYQSVEEWGTVYARGAEIVPDALYTARAVDAVYGPGSATGLAKTWKWGNCETGGDCNVNILDISCVIAVFQGNPTETCTFHGADVTSTTDPCGPPDGVVNISDISAVAGAFRGEPFPCDDPCEE